MKRILLIGTGGTIASEMTEGGLTPELTTEQLLAHIPAIREICRVECVQLLNLDSTSITPQHWLMMARCIQERYDLYDGFVITHGTDTMAYTAAALSYLIQGSPKPIILTGAQKPIGFDSTDSKINLADAFRCAASDLPGVSIVFNSHVILGTRARKTRSKSFQAFSSINYPDLGVLRDGVLLRYIRQDCHAAPVFFDTLDFRVALLKLTPGQDRAAADFLLERNDALIIESFGYAALQKEAKEMAADLLQSEFHITDGEFRLGARISRIERMEMSHPVSYPHSEEEQTGGLPETHYRQEAPEQRMSDSQRQVKHAASITPQKKEKKQLIL